MKKKQIIGLGTLLLVCLLGLFTTSYADEYTVTLNNIDELFSYYSNVTWYNNVPASTMKTRAINCLNNYQSSYNNLMIEIYNSSGKYSLNFYFFDNGNVTNFFYNSVNDYQLDCSNIKRVSIASDYADTIVRVRRSSNGIYVMWRNDIRNYSAPFQNLGVMTFASPQVPFTFLEAETDTYADVWSYEDVPFYVADSNEDLYLGQLCVPDTTISELSHFNNFYYRYGTWQFRQLPINSIYLIYEGEENNTSFYETYLKKDYFYENTLYNIVWTDYSTEPYTLASANFYIKNINTVITNGVLDTSQTFSGDYYQQYEAEQQDIKDIDNISQGVSDVILDDSEVDTILDNFDTSGEIASYFGYQNFNEDQDSVFFEGKDIIFYCISETIEELMRSGDEYIDIQFHGEPYRRIYSRYFKTPTDNMLFIFLKWFLTFAGCYALYANIFATGEALSKLNLWEAMNKNDVDLFIFRM